MGGGLSAILRAWGLFLVALALFVYTFVESEPHAAADANAPATSFSSARAEAVLARLLGPEKPHPVASPENAAVRGRILKEFASLGVPTEAYRAFTCRGRFFFASCATVTDVIADVIPGDGKAIVLLAHYDSVPAGPGASDDESGVATVLETVRALKARGGKSLHPVIAVITDGEEAGLLGANAFLQNETLKGRVGAVVNVEARGTKGPSLLFQTSPGDGKLIDLYAKSVPVYATSSLYAEIYRFLPNDTDLTIFIHDGFPSFNFAFADNVRYYHTPFDIRANLDPATLQMHGDNLLGVASALETTPYDALKGGNDVYLTLFGAFLPRMPAGWALPLAILVLVVIGFAVWGSPNPARPGRVVTAAVMPLALIFGSAVFGWLLSFIAQLVSGHPDPTYAYPLAMRYALGLAVFAVVVLAARMTTANRAVGAAWLWIAVLGVVLAALLPGFSPYFLFPALPAAVLLLVASRAPDGFTGSVGQLALFVGALAMFVIWIPLVVSGETLMGLRLHPMFTVPAAFAALGAVPLLATHPMSREAARASASVAAFAAVVLAVVAGLMPAYSKASPQRVNIVYLENGNAPARWIADTSWKGIGAEPIPAQLKDAGPFALQHDAWEGLRAGDGYVAAAGAPRFALPKVTIDQDRVTHRSRIVGLHIQASDAADGVVLSVPKEAGLTSLAVRGQIIDEKDNKNDTYVACVTPDCRDLDVTLTLAETRHALDISFAEMRYGLPDFGKPLQAARPMNAMASQSGDQVFLATKVKLPAR